MSGGRARRTAFLRETKEETGLTLTSYRLRGVLTFMYNDDDAEMEYIFLYTADGFTGELADCNEGTLEWVPKTEINSLNLWEGDRIFHRLLDEEAPFFSLKLRYQDDLLKEAVLDGKPLELLDLLDENGEPSGQVRERTLVHLNGDWHRTSHVWVVRRRGTADMTCFYRSGAARRTPSGAATISPAPGIFRRDRTIWSRRSGS